MQMSIIMHTSWVDAAFAAPAVSLAWLSAMRPARPLLLHANATAAGTNFGTEARSRNNLPNISKGSSTAPPARAGRRSSSRGADGNGGRSRGAGRRSASDTACPSVLGDDTTYDDLPDDGDADAAINDGRHKRDDKYSIDGDEHGARTSAALAALFPPYFPTLYAYVRA